MSKTTKEAEEINEQLVQAQQHIAVLREALKKVLERLNIGSSMHDVAGGATFEERPFRMSAFPPAALPWQLIRTERLLVTPTREIISLSKVEYQLIYQTFSSPSLRVTFAEVDALMAHKSSGPQMAELSSAAKMRLSRLRKKINEHGLEFPLYSVRATGLQFLGSADLS